MKRKTRSATKGNNNHPKLHMHTKVVTVFTEQKTKKSKEVFKKERTLMVPKLVNVRKFTMIFIQLVLFQKMQW